MILINDKDTLNMNVLSMLFYTFRLFKCLKVNLEYVLAHVIRVQYMLCINYQHIVLISESSKYIHCSLPSTLCIKYNILPICVSLDLFGSLLYNK